jgi:hypothetical protein
MPKKPKISTTEAHEILGIIKKLRGILATSEKTTEGQLLLVHQIFTEYTEKKIKTSPKIYA